MPNKETKHMATLICCGLICYAGWKHDTDTAMRAVFAALICQHITIATRESENQNDGEE
ncbi:hypothetical protein KAR91_57480 [Candidatus Pacearchaeota archaeon]|nr:hypothetical protein [Candidatus Pacearchaeota archaeon]